MSALRINDAYPALALNQPGAPAEIVVELEGTASTQVTVTAQLLDRGRLIARSSVACALGTAGCAVMLELPVPAADPYGYSVKVDAVWDSGSATAGTAILAASHWRAVPRYGFLADFEHPPQHGEAHPARTLSRFHITVVQFYDWMYRHYRFLPPEGAADNESQAFVDAMGRPVSLAAVRAGIDACHANGMAAIAYGAVYGAEPEFILDHPDWLLYDANDQPQHLIERFYITDLRPGPWRDHIMGEFEAAVGEMNFDGIHLDQYGFPRMAYAHDGQHVDLSDDFPGLIDEAAARVAEKREGAGVIFNAVNDWPIECIAPTHQAAVYIEVWSPHDSYRDLVGLIHRARELSGKQVILAAYLRPFHQPGEEAEWSLRYATAVINSAGGHHLILGEANRVLREPYYPDHGPLSPSGASIIRRYFDHTAALTHYLHAQELQRVERQYTTGINTAITLVGAPVSATPAAGAVWLSVARRPNQLVLNLVNLTGLTTLEWDAARQAPPPLTGTLLKFDPFFKEARITWQTPDTGDGFFELPLVVDSNGQRSVELPSLELWATVVMDLS